jgi:hypothetical protein
VVCLKRKEDADETASAKTKTNTETQQTAPSGTTGSA